MGMEDIIVAVVVEKRMEENRKHERAVDTC